MKTLDGLIQGSDEWAAVRARYHTASEAPIMMGASKKATRNDLLRMKATGDEQEFSRWVREVLFERGHQIEEAARPVAERIVGEELYPTTGVDGDGVLLASFDGISLLEDVVWECKQFNQAKASDVEAGRIPPEDYWQVVQQLVVSRAERCLYMVTDGTEDGTVYTWVTLDADDEDRLHAGWKQFDDDLANYQPREHKPAAVGSAPESLPALRIEVTGAVQASNLSEFRGHALAVFEGIRTDLKTDEDFADAEQTVKWCKDVESRLDAAKEHALSQTASIDELFRSIDDIKEQARKKRLELDRAVKSRKEAIRGEIRHEAVEALRNHYRTINESLEGALGEPADFGSNVAEAMKGKKTVKSLRDAVDHELARAKIEANEAAERIRGNVARLREMASDHPTLFPDRDRLVLKEREDMEATVKARIAEHEERERKRLEIERERIRQEEQKKARDADEGARIERDEVAAEPPPAGNEGMAQSNQIGRVAVTINCTFETEISAEVSDRNLERSLRKTLADAGINSLVSMNIHRHKETA